jgi:hypothetical protein
MADGKAAVLAAPILPSPMVKVDIIQHDGVFCT